MAITEKENSLREILRLVGFIVNYNSRQLNKKKSIINIKIIAETVDPVSGVHSKEVIQWPEK